MAKKDFLNVNIAFGGTGLVDRALLAKHLAVTQQSGLSISESLNIAEETAKGKMKKIDVQEFHFNLENNIFETCNDFKHLIPRIINTPIIPH